MQKLWKNNWEETRQHYLDWWNQKGLVFSTAWGRINAQKPHADIADPGPAPSVEARHIDVNWRARSARYQLSRQSFAADNLPLADTQMGAGSLALFLGCEPGLSAETVWFRPTITEPDTHPPLLFDARNKWWQVQEAMMAAYCRHSDGNYFVGCTDLVENIDILSALRDPQTLMIDLRERPDWVKAKIAEIDGAYVEVYDRIHKRIKLDDGSICFGAFFIWGPGRTAKIQCDAAAMISPDMFKEFVVPSLTQQCQWLDHSMYHLDGTDCIRHLDHLLAIEDLDAIEWTPQALAQPAGGDPKWFDMYKRILDAGKSLQIINARKHEVIPLLDRFGGNGLYIAVVDFDNEAELQQLGHEVDRYRP